MRRGAACALLAALLLAVAGCGGDDEEADTTASSPTASETQESETGEATTEAEATETEEAEPEATATDEAQPQETETEPADSPEEQPGGGGDEEPARSLALFTGQGGRITPRVVRVPAFIAIRVELRARDGNSYGLRIGGKTIEVSDSLGSVSTTLPGLRPGQAVAGVPVGARGRVRIEATAEPGP